MDKITENIIRRLIQEAIIDEVGANNITPTNALLKKWFDELNQKYFGGNLPDIRIVVEPMKRDLWGVFSSKGRTYYTRNRQWAKPFNPDYVHIGISSYYNGPEVNLKNTLLHEMIHYYIHYKLKYHPTRSHGWEFEDEAYRVNALAKKLGEPYNITATNDYAENEVSQLALDKFKNKITGEYIVGIDHSKDKYGRETYWFFRTEEKFIPAIVATYRHSDIKFYKMYIDNPKFALQTSVCRSRISGDVGYSEKEVIDKVKKEYGDFRLEPLKIDNSEKKISGKHYKFGILRLNGKTFYTFKTELKYIPKIKEEYYFQNAAGNLEFFDVTDYDINFDVAPVIKSKIKFFGYGLSEEESINDFKKKFNTNFSFE